MNYKYVLKNFILFLKKEQVYKDYLKNLKNGAEYRLRCARISKIDEIEWLTETVKICPQNLILDAFRWMGFESDMWQELSEKWMKQNGFGI